MIRPDLPDAEICIRLEMEEYGWAKLHITLDAVSVTIHLSEVFDPFYELVAWGQKIDEGDLPIQMEIDEEGQEAILTVLRTDNPDSVLLRVTRKFPDEVLLEGIVLRTALASALKIELRRFFMIDFDPQHWDLRGNEIHDEDNPPVQVKDQILNHAWLSSHNCIGGN